MKIDCLKYLPDEFRTSAVQLFLGALRDKLVPILGTDGRAQTVLEMNLDTTQCLTAIHDGKFAGILAIKSSQGSFLNPTLIDLIRTYGLLGGIVRMSGLAMLDYSTAPDEFYVDGVAVVDKMRGEGIGSQLFDMLERVALERKIRKISLEIIDTNHGARALYKRLGFIETGCRSLWPFNLIFKFPFKSSIQMVKILD